MTKITEIVFISPDNLIHNYSNVMESCWNQCHKSSDYFGLAYCKVTQLCLCFMFYVFMVPFCKKRKKTTLSPCLPFWTHFLYSHLHSLFISPFLFHSFVSYGASVSLSSSDSFFYSAQSSCHRLSLSHSVFDYFSMCFPPSPSLYLCDSVFPSVPLPMSDSVTLYFNLSLSLSTPPLFSVSMSKIFLFVRVLRSLFYLFLSPFSYLSDSQSLFFVAFSVSFLQSLSFSTSLSVPPLPL